LQFVVLLPWISLFVKDPGLHCEFVYIYIPCELEWWVNLIGFLHIWNDNCCRICCGDIVWFLVLLPCREHIWWLVSGVRSDLTIGFDNWWLCSSVRTDFIIDVCVVVCEPNLPNLILILLFSLGKVFVYLINLG
jgi:hypothetical protein